MWLARHGSLVGLLLWPGVLFYALYAYAIYLVGAPFTVLVLWRRSSLGYVVGPALLFVSGLGGVAFSVAG